MPALREQPTVSITAGVISSASPNYGQVNLIRHALPTAIPLPVAAVARLKISPRVRVGVQGTCLSRSPSDDLVM